MAIRPILEAPDPRLRTISARVERIDDELHALIADMFETMYDAPGIGLAAVQVGVAKRVLVMDLGDQQDADGKPIREPRVFINPELFDPSDDRNVYNEGCLSVPEQYADVERPAAIHARWMDADGAQHEARLDGMLATCLQHEMDHLEGVLFIDRLSRLKRDMVMRKLDKSRRGRRAA